jgi:peptide-methionine (S)-S-oxide reductase
MMVSIRTACLLLATGVFLGCAQDGSGEKDVYSAEESNMTESGVVTLGAGCFWCTEAAYNLIDGVTDVRVGYMGGGVVEPTYEQICTGTTGHAEVAQLRFDPKRVSLETILKVFWAVHNPTSLNKQGGDVGSQYRSGVYYHAESDKSRIAESLKLAQKDFSEKIVTEVLPASTFYEAENYHQDYYNNNPNAGYCRMVIAPKLKKVRKLIDE